MTEKKESISIKFRKWLGRWWGGYCPECGSKLIFHEDIFNGGYKHYMECPHCDNLDRFDIPSDYRPKKVIETTVKELKKEAVNYIMCVDCGVGMGATDDEVYKHNRRRFVKTHWGHNKQENGK